MRKENTLLAKTDALENTHSADTPESIEDDHGATALKKKRARGGKVEGPKPKHRLDRPAFARGGNVKGKGRTNVNVIIAPQGGGGGGPGAMMPPPSSQMPPPPPMMPPHPPMGPPPGAMPPPGPPQGIPPQMVRKSGGRVSMDAGAGSGEGRLEKIRAYGDKAKA